MRIYTRTGDGGETSLFNGTRVQKDDARIEAYGTLGELNAIVGGLLDHGAIARTPSGPRDPGPPLPDWGLRRPRGPRPGALTGAG